MSDATGISLDWFHHSQSQRYPSVCTFFSRLERLVPSQRIYFFPISKSAILPDKAAPHPSPIRDCLFRASSFCFSCFREPEIKREDYFMISVIEFCCSVLNTTAGSPAIAVNLQYCRHLALDVFLDVPAICYVYVLCILHYFSICTVLLNSL